MLVYMKKPAFLQFCITQDSDGSYTANALGHAIFTEGTSLEETMHNIREATECHFEETEVATPLRSFPILANFEVPQFA
jgi:predicted RNA binding protein YcfA (HicA-like mRNA interferase family)/predicted RNase H-like HicB family nuclease